MKGRPIRFTDDQWDAVQQIAASVGMTASDFVRDAVGAQVRAAGSAWPSAPGWGGIRKGEAESCPRCGGWNVGELDGVKACADCGWTSVPGI